MVHYDRYRIYLKLLYCCTLLCMCSIYFLYVNVDNDGYKHTTLKARVNPMLREKVCSNWRDLSTDRKAIIANGDTVNKNNTELVQTRLTF